MIDIDLAVLVLASAVSVFAGLVKGAVGFAMPMIMISAFASFVPADQALAMLILPTLAANLAQALRQGWGAAITTTLEYRKLLIPMCVTIALAAQLVPLLPQAVMLALLGVPIVLFAITRLAGWQLRFDASRRGRAEFVAGVVGGFFGGISGVWGPPTIALLISLNVEKRENVRVQGVVYLIGSVILLVAHLGSGVANSTTLPLSALLLVPSMIGLYLGFAIQDRLDQARFARWTLVVLAISGLNLVRRALGF